MRQCFNRSIRIGSRRDPITGPVMQAGLSAGGAGARPWAAALPADIAIAANTSPAILRVVARDLSGVEGAEPTVGLTDGEDDAARRRACATAVLVAARPGFHPTRIPRGPEIVGSSAILRPVAFPKCAWNARKRPLSPRHSLRHVQAPSPLSGLPDTLPTHSSADAAARTGRYDCTRPQPCSGPRAPAPPPRPRAGGPFPRRSDRGTTTGESSRCLRSVLPFAGRFQMRRSAAWGGPGPKATDAGLAERSPPADEPAVGERVLGRLEGALNRLPARIAGSGATPGRKGATV